MLMRRLYAVSMLLLVAAPCAAQRNSQSTMPLIATARDEALWAEWEAQARITEGDYDGAVQAERQADADRQKVDEQEAEQRNRPAAPPKTP